MLARRGQMAGHACSVPVASSRQYWETRPACLAASLLANFALQDRPLTKEHRALLVSTAKVEMLISNPAPLWKGSTALKGPHRQQDWRVLPAFSVPVVRMTRPVMRPQAPTVRPIRRRQRVHCVLRDISARGVGK